MVQTAQPLNTPIGQAEGLQTDKKTLKRLERVFADVLLVPIEGHFQDFCDWFSRASFQDYFNCN